MNQMVASKDGTPIAHQRSSDGPDYSLAYEAEDIAVLPGQQHNAHYTAPELFAAEVVRFLDET